MTEPTLNEQIAIRLGWREVIPSGWGFEPGCKEAKPLRPWVQSRDLIARDLLPVLTEEQWELFTTALTESIESKLNGAPVESQGHATRLLLTATPEQLCRAFLAATEPKS